MAFERLEPFGDAHMDQRFKVLASWLCTVCGKSSTAYQAGDIKGISPEMPPDSDVDESDADAELWDDADGDTSHGGSASSADVLRDLREQNLFR